MKRVFAANHKAFNADMAILILRVGISILMLTHGVPKLMKFFADEPITFSSVMGMGPHFTLFLAVFAEVICSVFLILGLFTRWATIPLIMTMLTAILLVHAADPLAVKEKAILYLLGYILIFCTGAGKYSIDRKMYNKHTNTFLLT